MTLANVRREYMQRGLRESDCVADPMQQFRQWLDQALAADLLEPTAITLATTTRDGRPSARIVLLKGIDERGFVFFTNYDSRKGHELAENPQGALVFYWPDMERQICVAGTVTKLPAAESENYFKSRPRGARLAAWASRQSHVLPDRGALEKAWKELETRFASPEVPMPPYWGGNVLSPTRIEFWQGRPNRLHDRFRYTKQPDNTWKLERLSP